MMFDFLRRAYAKILRMQNESEKEMKEWAQRDLEGYAYYIHYCHINVGGGTSGFIAYKSL